MRNTEQERPEGRYPRTRRNHCGYRDEFPENCKWDR